MSDGYAIIPRSLVNDPTFRELSDRAVRAFFCIATGPHANIIGAFSLPDGYLSADLDWPIETVRETVSELISAGFVNRFGGGHYVRVVRHPQWNTIANPNVMKAALKQLAGLPADLELVPIFNWLKPLCERFSKGSGKGLSIELERLRKRLPKPIANTEAEAEAEIESKTEIETSGKEGAKAVDKAAVELVVDLAEACGSKLLRLVHDVGGEQSFHFWFGGARVRLGDPRAVLVREAHKRDHIAREFMPALRKAIGQDVVVASIDGHGAAA